MGKIAWQKTSRGFRNPVRYVGILRGASSFYFMRSDDRLIHVEELPSGRFAVRHYSQTKAVRYVESFERAIAFAEEWLLAKVIEATLKHNALQEAAS